MKKPTRSRPESVVAIIPARLGSTRLPGKVLLDRTGKPLIQHVYESTRKARVLDRVVVATDDRLVLNAVLAFGGEAVLTRRNHPNGTSRLGEAARTLGLSPRDIVVNVQGDEPEMEPRFITSAVRSLRLSTAQVATVAVPFSDPDDPANPNIVKAVVDRTGRALYFSRAQIPFVRDPAHAPAPLRHVGLYIYRCSFLWRYITLTPAPIERCESLEQLRALWHGFGIQVATCKGPAPAGIDTPEQYEAFVARYSAKSPRRPRAIPTIAS